MATKTPKTDPNATPTPAPAPSVDLAAAILQLAKQLGASHGQQTDILEQLKENAPKREMDYAEYLTKNPVPRLKRPWFQNAYPVNPHGLGDATISKLDELKPGEYMNGVVRVIEKGNAERDGESYTRFFIYKNRTIADRFELTQHFTSFVDLVEKVYAEQLARDKAN